MDAIANTKRRVFKIISTSAAAITFVIAVWQFIVWHQEKSQPNYSGEWSMSCEIETAEMQKYKGMKIDWVIHLTQNNNRLTGIAEKISVNSVKLDYKDRTTLSIDGSIEHDNFNLPFIEKGKLRESRGIFVGEFSSDKFQGTFSSTASDTRGKIAGYRIK